MQDLLNQYRVAFPKRNEQVYTLNQLVNHSPKNKYHLPIIVKVTSSNNYGRATKNLLTKNTELLLVGVYELHSILAEYHRSHDGRLHHHIHRHRLPNGYGKTTTKGPTKFPRMHKLSKSLASLTTVSHLTTSTTEEESVVDCDDDQTYRERNIVKTFNEKRSTSVQLCRIPVQYRRLFELLNESDQSAEPYHKLLDLILPGYPEKHKNKWPHAFLLRSSCTAYTQKETSEEFGSTSTNDQYSSSMVSNDSFHSVSSDYDSEKSLVFLNEETQLLQAGQILTILGDYMCVHMGSGERDHKEAQQPQTPTSPLHISPSTWIRDKSKVFFSKRRRRSQTSDQTPIEFMHSKSNSEKCGLYLKCQTQQGDLFYISLHEPGTFSPLNYLTPRSKSNSDLSCFDISEVYQLKDLHSNFRFPLSVRHLDGEIYFENICLPASINSDEPGTKLRLLMPYNEQVVFACLINSTPSKWSKTPLPFLVLPISINADIDIQPCTNMQDISETEDFPKLVDACFQLVEQYRTEISLIHFPLQFTTNTHQRKQALHKKRSQSASVADYVGEDRKHSFRGSDDRLNYMNEYHPQHSSSSISALHNRDSTETVKQKFSTETDQTIVRRADNHGKKKKKNDKQRRSVRIADTVEDEIYDDVDKIYDYIRSGDVTGDVEKIQAKEQNQHTSYTMDQLNSTDSGSDEQTFATPGTASKMIPYRNVPRTEQSRAPEQNLDSQPSKTDGNVDDDQAQALYMVSKQHWSASSQGLFTDKATVKVKNASKN